MIIENQEKREQRLQELKYILLSKKYPENVINIGIEKALAQTPQELRVVKEKGNNDNNLLCLVTTYNPNNPAVFQLIRKTLPMLNQSAPLKSIMTRIKVIHSQRQPRNLKRMLTNSYFKRSDQDPEVKKCGVKRCGTCPYLKEGREFTFSTRNETFRVKHSMNCTSTNLVYVITCAGCGQNYKGETGDVLRNRVTVHKQQIRDPDTRMLGVSAHIDECAAELTLGETRSIKQKEKTLIFHILI